jgi:hypothetical protein
MIVADVVVTATIAVLRALNVIKIIFIHDTILSVKNYQKPYTLMSELGAVVLHFDRKNHNYCTVVTGFKKRQLHRTRNKQRQLNFFGIPRKAFLLDNV